MCFFLFLLHPTAEHDRQNFIKLQFSGAQNNEEVSLVHKKMYLGHERSNNVENETNELNQVR